MNPQLQQALQLLKQKRDQMMGGISQMNQQMQTPQGQQQGLDLAMKMVMGGMTSAPNVISRMAERPLSSLISHEGAPDESRVQFYMNLLREGKKIDPLKIIREGINKFGIEDGKHRFEALKRLGLTNALTEQIRRI